MLEAFGWIFLGLVLAGVGGEAFLKGAVGIASWARIPASIIGLTVAAFATSSPELSVAITSAMAGTPSISLGDALGSNVVNIALILGSVFLISDTPVNTKGAKRDIPIAIIQPILLIVLALDGELSRVDAVIMLLIFFGWLGSIMIEAIGYRKETANDKKVESNIKSNLLYSSVGLVLLVLAGKSIVHGAENIGHIFNIDPFIIGATLVALGTSAPELATTVLSKLRGHSDIGLGTVLGSNIFNGLFIISIAALIHPITVNIVPLQVSLAFGIISVLLLIPPKKRVFTRQRGIGLLALYSLYITLTVVLR